MSKNNPKEIYIHCSASPDSRDSVDAAEIDQWHKERGWDGIGYHWVIKRDGTCERGRSELVQGAHARGFNKDSLAICLVGDRHFTATQMSMLCLLLYSITNRYNISADKIKCHYQVTDKKTCPNIPVEAIRTMFMFYKMSVLHPTPQKVIKPRSF